MNIMILKYCYWNNVCEIINWIYSVLEKKNINYFIILIYCRKIWLYKNKYIYKYI